MLHEEFFERTKVSLTGEEYAEVEHIYNSVQMDKDEFCKLWLKNRENKIIAELMNTIKKLEDDCRKMRDDCEALTSEMDELKNLHSGEMDERSMAFDAHIKEFGRKIITNIDDYSRIYDACEEEFGLNFICKCKLEEGIELESHEAQHLIKMLCTK